MTLMINTQRNWQLLSYSAYLLALVLSFFVALCASPLSVQAANSASSKPSPTLLFQATYKGQYGSLPITMMRKLTTQDHKTYHLKSEAKAFAGRILETSIFNLHENTLAPAQYRYERKVFGVEKKESLSFNWQAQTALYEKAKKPARTRSIETGSLDPTLYQLQMQRQLSQSPAAETLNYTFARRMQTKTYNFERQGKEEITVAGKAYEAVLFKRGTKKDSVESKETRVWLIPALDYVIGKIEHTEDGDSYQVMLTSYRSSEPFRAFLMKATKDSKTTTAKASSNKQS